MNCDVRNFLSICFGINESGNHSKKTYFYGKSVRFSFLHPNQVVGNRDCIYLYFSFNSDSKKNSTIIKKLKKSSKQTYIFLHNSLQYETKFVNKLGKNVIAFNEKNYSLLWKEVTYIFDKNIKISDVDEADKHSYDSKESYKNIWEVDSTAL
jgi:hypothetical protein